MTEKDAPPSGQSFSFARRHELPQSGRGAFEREAGKARDGLEAARLAQVTESDGRQVHQPDSATPLHQPDQPHPSFASPGQSSAQPDWFDVLCQRQGGNAPSRNTNDGRNRQPTTAPIRKADRDQWFQQLMRSNSAEPATKRSEPRAKPDFKSARSKNTHAFNQQNQSIQRKR